MVKTFRPVLLLKNVLALVLACSDPKTRENVSSAARLDHTIGEDETMWMQVYFLLFGLRVGKSLSMFPKWQSRIPIKNFMMKHGYGKVDSYVVSQLFKVEGNPCILVHAAMEEDWRVVRSLLQMRWPSDPSNLPALHRALLLTCTARGNCLKVLDLLLSMLPGEKFANEELPDVVQSDMSFKPARPVHWIFFAGLVGPITNDHKVTPAVAQLVNRGLPIISQHVLQRLVQWGTDLNTCRDIIRDHAHPVSGSKFWQIQQLMTSNLTIFCEV